MEHYLLFRGRSSIWSRLFLHLAFNYPWDFRFSFCCQCFSIGFFPENLCKSGYYWINFMSIRISCLLNISPKHSRFCTRSIKGLGFFFMIGRSLFKYFFDRFFSQEKLRNWHFFGIFEIFGFFSSTLWKLGLSLVKLRHQHNIRRQFFICQLVIEFR